jgi:hypothetical protein
MILLTRSGGDIQLRAGKQYKLEVTHPFPHVNISSFPLLPVAFLLHLDPLLRFHIKYLGGNASSKDRLGQQEAYQPEGAVVACLVVADG